MPSADSDRRRDKRLSLNLPVQFAAGAGDDLLLCDGLTHNVSSGGVYLEVPAGRVSRGGAVALRIGVDQDPASDQPSVTLVGSGVVRRVDQLPEGRVAHPWPDMQLRQGIVGVAVQFDTRPTVQLQSLEGFFWRGGGEAPRLP